jgi:hypothetical protein
MFVFADFPQTDLRRPTNSCKYLNQFVTIIASRDFVWHNRGLPNPRKRLIGTNPQVKNFVTSIPAKQQQNKGGRRVIIVEILISGPGGINNLRQRSGYHFIEVR